MIPENLTRVFGPNLTLRLIQPEDAAYVHALRSDPAYNRHLSEVRGTIEDQYRWIEAYNARESDPRDCRDHNPRGSGAIPASDG